MIAAAAAEAGTATAGQTVTVHADLTQVTPDRRHRAGHPAHRRSGHPGDERLRPLLPHRHLDGGGAKPVAATIQVS
ncbi:hypothetical protein [Amycolatopsis sp. NPDC003731]